MEKEFLKSKTKSKGQRLGWTSKGDEKLMLEERLKVVIEVKTSSKKATSPKAQHFLIP